MRGQKGCKEAHLEEDFKLNAVQAMKVKAELYCLCLFGLELKIFSLFRSSLELIDLGILLYLYHVYVYEKDLSSLNLFQIKTNYCLCFVIIVR